MMTSSHPDTAGSNMDNDALNHQRPQTRQSMSRGSKAVSFQEGSPEP
jgi:hypothetical protein